MIHDIEPEKVKQTPQGKQGWYKLTKLRCTHTARKSTVHPAHQKRQTYTVFVGQIASKKKKKQTSKGEKKIWCRLTIVVAMGQEISAAPTMSGGGGGKKK